MRETVIIWLLLVIASSCSGKTRSERETRRDEIRSQAEHKRQELGQVAGLYYGAFVTEQGDESGATLRLEVIDLPKEVEGELDPVILPVLAGSVRFHLGSSQTGPNEETVSFALTSSVFDAERGTIDIVSDNGVYSSLLLELAVEDNGDLQGSWNLTSASLAGGALFSRATASGGAANLSDYLGPGIAGRYLGFVDWDREKRSQLAEMALSLNDAPPDSVETAGALRIYFGEKPGAEFLAFRFPKVNFQPLSGRITAISTDGSVTLTAKVVNGCVKGEWIQKQQGKMGSLNVCQQAIDLATLAIMEPLSGTYLGRLQNSNPVANLPERVQIGLVARGVEGDGEPINWVGDMRFYLGDISGSEYYEMAMSEIEYDPFTKAFSGQIKGDYNFSLVGRLRYGDFSGVLIQDGAGEIATVVVDRKEID